MIDGHGDDVFRYGDRIKYNFSTNIHQNVDHTGLLKHIASLGDIFKNYPAPEAVDVESVLAQNLSIGNGNVIVTNGATEAIYLLAQIMQGRHSAIIVPTFREYQDACRVFKHRISFISTLQYMPQDSDLVWICNPNNPTGKVIDVGLLKERIGSNPEKLFVIDQAYADYSMEDVLPSDIIFELPNVIILSSLTKRYAVPGLRIGYAIGSEKTIDCIRGIRMPWSVNSIAIESALYLLKHSCDYHIDAYALHTEILRIAVAFSDMGISTTRSDCNFLLASLPDGSPASELKSWLIDNYGILIRDASNFESLGRCHFRVAAQTEEENDILINAVRKWMSL